MVIILDICQLLLFTFTRFYIFFLSFILNLKDEYENCRHLIRGLFMLLVIIRFTHNFLIIIDLRQYLEMS